MARDCTGCLYDVPLVGTTHADPVEGGGYYYVCECTRGPIERELRASRGMADLSTAALRVLQDACDDMRRRGYGRFDWGDAMSAAIEAAAALGL